MRLKNSFRKINGYIDEVMYMGNHSGIFDSGAKLQIIPHTRQIVVPDTCKIIGTVGDHLSEQVTFQCPKEIDGHSIKDCSDHFVTWQDPSGKIGHDGLTLADEDGECLYYVWTVRGHATTTAGVVSFSVHFEDYAGEGDSICPSCGSEIDSDGMPIYRWSTTECTDCSILNSINAPISVYEAIYVDGDNLVFADHTPVRDETLMLETNGIVPDGELQISENGHYIVGEYASVNVTVPNDRVPEITVSENGEITASCGTDRDTVTEQLSAKHDPDFTPYNIRIGKTIFGVEGAFDPYPTKVNLTWDIIRLELTNGEPTVEAQSTGFNGALTNATRYGLQGGMQVCVGSIVIFTFNANDAMYTGFRVTDMQTLRNVGSGLAIICKVTGNSPKFEANMGKLRGNNT